MAISDHDAIAARDPDDEPRVPASASEPPPTGGGGWQGPTYYGRSQLKPAPFDNWVVGGYIFLAGVSGASAMISAAADLMRPRDADGRHDAEGTVRRGRYLSLLAPTIGAALLVYDLHTPKRFYNMLRIAKGTSPMSIGTWILMSFSGFAFANAFAQFVADRVPRFGWLRSAARVGQVPAAAAGAGLSCYTAALLSATSTPLWAAAPQALAVRFGSSAVAAGASALSLGERDGRTRRVLDALAVTALAVELAGTVAAHNAYRRRGVAAALEGGWGQVEKYGATGIGVAAPLGLHAVSVALGRKSGRLSGLASLATLAGSLLLRVSIMESGDESAARPDISFRFSQPENLP